MINKTKFLEYFDPTKISVPIHIVGCGAIGSHIAEQLVRMGCTGIHLWDFDVVSAHNIANQMFKERDINRPKVDAVLELMIEINDELKDTVTLHPHGWKDEVLNGHVFLCVDDIDLRRAIVKSNQYNPNCISFFDFRMRLTDAQHYAAIRDNEVQMGKLLASMDFSHEEAKDATPKSACGTTLSVVYTVKAITSFGMVNFVNHILGRPIKEVMLVDLNLLTLDAFPLK